MMRMKPGDRVAVIWIRPGQGRMEAEIEAVESPRAWERIVNIGEDR